MTEQLAKAIGNLIDAKLDLYRARMVDPGADELVNEATQRVVDADIELQDALSDFTYRVQP